jgi:hypothetical protein
MSTVNGPPPTPPPSPPPGQNQGAGQQAGALVFQANPQRAGGQPSTIARRNNQTGQVAVVHQGGAQSTARDPAEPRSSDRDAGTRWR